MKSRYKAYLKLNLLSLFFIAVSFISVSLAWFAYSGLANVATEIDVKTWLVEFQKNNAEVSNNIVISLAEIYPGMETVHETVKIKNKGDSDAQLSYSITSARILDETLSSEVNTSEYIVDKLSNDYPFKININLSKNYVLSGGDESVFDVSISWPLDSGDDELDSSWGNKSYLFQDNEQKLLAADKNYQVRPSVKVVIAVKAEQFIGNDNSNDINYNLGDVLLYDVSTNSKCSQLSSTCLKTYVIDTNNKIGDETVTLLPDLYNTYSSGTYDKYDTLLNTTTSSWKVITRPLVISDLLNIVSKDVMNSLIIRENISDFIIGSVSYNDRVNNIVNKTVSYNGYYTFLNEKFSYLSTNKCYWINTEYKVNDEMEENETVTSDETSESTTEEIITKAFALTKIDDTKSKIYGEAKTSTCSAVPVIIVKKSDLVPKNNEE